MLRVENKIKECDGRHTEVRDINAVKLVAVHRFGWNDLREYEIHGIAPDAIGVRDFYRDNPEASTATGGKMPYTFVIGRGGTVWQACDLGIVTPHAKRFNVSAIGVACLGDFRTLPPADEQKTSLVDLCAALARFFSLEVSGHTELPGATHDSAKQCPGRCLDMGWLRSTIGARNDMLAGEELTRSGVVF